MDKIKRKIYLDKIIEFMKNDFPIIKNLKDYGFYDQLSGDELNYVLSGIFEQPVKKYINNIINENGNQIYFENSDGKWWKKEYDDNGNTIYFENSNGEWEKSKYDEYGYIIYKETSNGLWRKWEYNDNGNIIYYEDSHGEIEIVDNK